MGGDARRALFKRGWKLDLPSGEVERDARRLAELGLIAILETEFVRCSNPEDGDQDDEKDRGCAGRVRLRPGVDEQDHGYHCPDCDRTVFPSQKRVYQTMQLRPQDDAIRAFVQAEVERAGLPVREYPIGLFRVEGREGEVHVCVADLCPDETVLRPGYSHGERVVFVVANVRDLGDRLPANAHVHRLVDIALGDGAAELVARIRRLARAGAPPSGPAILRADRLAVATPASPDRAPGAIRLPVTPGTTWAQVQIHRVDGDTVRISAPGHAPESFTSAQLGMTRRRSRERKRIMKWAILEALCEGHGACNWRTTGVSSFDSFKVQVSELRRLLRHIFALDDDPLPDCTVRGGLRAAFQAHPALPERPLYVGEDRW